MALLLLTLDLHFKLLVAIEAVDPGLSMGLVTNYAVNIAQVGLMGIAVFKFPGFRLIDQLVHGPMTGQAAAVFDRIAGLGKPLAVTLAANHPGFGMKIVRIAGTGPRTENLLHQSHVIAFQGAPCSFPSDQPERLAGSPRMTGGAVRLPFGRHMADVKPGSKPVFLCRTVHVRYMAGRAGGQIIPLDGHVSLRKHGG